MPKLKTELPRDLMQSLYIAILDHYDRYHDRYRGCAERIRIGGRQDVACLLKFGHLQAVLEDLACSPELDPEGKKGWKRIYRWYNDLKPILNKRSKVFEWRSAEVPLVFAPSLVDGLLRFAENKKLETDGINLAELRRTLMACFARKAVVTATSSRKRTQPLTAIDRMKSLGLPEDFPGGWLNTVWKMYERTEVGLCISFIRFYRQGDTVMSEMNTIYRRSNETHHFHYSGIAFMDSEKGYLIVPMFREEEPFTYASIIARVSPFHSKLQNAAIGHYTYFSVRFLKYFTKVVVLERFGDQSTPLPAAYEVFRDGREDDGDEDVQDSLNNRSMDKESSLPGGDGSPSKPGVYTQYRDISIHIRRYLFYRTFNRLTIPDDLILELEEERQSLRMWLREHVSLSEQEPRLKRMKGEYRIRYKHHHGDERELHLQIYPDDESMMEMYGEMRASIRLNNVVYRGQCKISNNTILQATLVPREDGATGRRSYIQSGDLFLQIKLPVSNDPEAFGMQVKEQSLSGLLAGLVDSDRNMPIAYTCLIESREKENKTSKSAKSKGNSKDQMLQHLLVKPIPESPERR